MRVIPIGLVLSLIALPVCAETKQQYDWCYSPSASDDETIEGCTAVIQSGRLTGTALSTAVNSRSVGYAGKGQWDLALKDTTWAIQLDPTNAEAHNNRCDNLNHKGLQNQAIPECTRAIELKPGYGHAYYNRGVAYEATGRSQLAIADYRAALKAHPTDREVLDALKRLGVTP